MKIWHVYCKLTRRFSWRKIKFSCSWLVFSFVVPAFLPLRVGRTYGNPWGWPRGRWHFGGNIVVMGVSVKYSFSGVWLLSWRWRVVVPSRFYDISVSCSLNSLLGCFVAFFLRPPSGLRTDLFLTGLIFLLALRLRRTVWRDDLHRARTHVATVGGEWEDRF